MDLKSYLRDHSAPLALLLVSSGLVVAGTFGMLGLASDEASGFLGYYGESDLVYLLSFHSLVVGKVAVLLVAIVKVFTVLEDVDGKVLFHRDAFVMVALLEDVTLNSLDL